MALSIRTLFAGCRAVKRISPTSNEGASAGGAQVPFSPSFRAMSGRSACIASAKRFVAIVAVGGSSGQSDSHEPSNKRSMLRHGNLPHARMVTGTLGTHFRKNPPACAPLFAGTFQPVADYFSSARKGGFRAWARRLLRSKPTCCISILSRRHSKAALEASIWSAAESLHMRKRQSRLSVKAAS